MGVTAFFIGGPISIWQEYFEKISTHRAFLGHELFNIGWPTIAGRLLPDSKLLVVIGAIAITGAYVFFLRRASTMPRMIFGMVIAFAWLSLSPYYYLMLPLFALLQPLLLTRTARISALTIMGIFFIHAVAGFYGLHYFSEDPSMHAWSEGMIFVLFLFQLVLIWSENRKKIEIFPHPA